jgi:hypothetical protein
VDSIQTFIEESLTVDKSSDFFWDLSLKHEPEEPEDEQMTRLLQESGFLLTYSNRSASWSSLWTVRVSTPVIVLYQSNEGSETHPRNFQ